MCTWLLVLVVHQKAYWLQDDLVRTDDVIFAATAITRGNLLNAIQYFPGGARTHTIVMRSKTGTVRFLDTVHMDEKLKSLKAK